MRVRVPARPCMSALHTTKAKSCTQPAATVFTDHYKKLSKEQVQTYEQPIGRDGVYEILRGRGWTEAELEGKRKAELLTILKTYDDCSNPAPWVVRMYTCRPRGHVILFAPKCHPELQFAIENTWCKLKECVRRLCDHTLEGLRQNILEAFKADNISMAFVQKVFRRQRTYVEVYRAKSATGEVNCGQTADAVCTAAAKSVKPELPKSTAKGSRTTGHTSHRRFYAQIERGTSFVPLPKRRHYDTVCAAAAARASAAAAAAPGRSECDAALPVAE